MSKSSLTWRRRCGVCCCLAFLALHSADTSAQVNEEERALVANLVEAVKSPMSDVDLSEAADAIRAPTTRKLAVTRLASLLQNESNEVVRGRAAQALAQFPGEAARSVPLLMEALRDSNENVRESAAWAISDMGPAARAAVPALTNVLRDEFGVRVAAITALGRIGPQSKSAVPRLVSGLDDPDTMRESIQALGQIGSGAAVPALTDRLQDQSADVRGLAAEALGDIGVQARGAMAALEACQDDTDRLVVACAGYAIARIDSDNPLARQAVANTLADLATDENFDVRNRAIVMIGKLGASARDAVPSLIAGLADETIAIRVASCEALGQIGGAAQVAIPQLQEAQDNDSFQLRRAARLALEKIQGNP